MNDVTYSLLHYDAELCAAVQQNRAREDIAGNWQLCIGTAATKADADICNNAYTACTQEYYKSGSAPSRLTRNAAGQLTNADRAAATDRLSRCLATTSKFETAKTATSLNNRMKAK
jgi:hypothetical protein